MISTDLHNKATDFIDTVLALRPTLAVFDCDGTLWSGDAGAEFFYWEIERGLVSREVIDRLQERYRLYKAGKVDEESMCGEMVTMNAGLSIDHLSEAAEEFFTKIMRSHIFPEMQELTQRLAQQGTELWAVSSTNNWVIEVGVREFGIPRDRVLAACVHVEDALATERLMRVPTDELKATAIREVIARPVDAVFGNSMHDFAMLELARYAYCINPNPDLEQAANERGWTIYWPAGTGRRELGLPKG